LVPADDTARLTDGQSRLGICAPPGPARVPANTYIQAPKNRHSFALLQIHPSMHQMSRPQFRIVVVGASAGGLAALSKLLGSLPPDFPAAILIVQHMAADVTGDVLVKALAKHTALRCAHALDGERIVSGHIYVAPPDHHLLVSKTRILISKGARENRSRPGIDPLFRSAAVAFGPRVVGVLLTGYLDDGTAGMIAIHRCGGVCIVQDPQDAAYPDMPQNALSNARIDHCLALAALGPFLAMLVRKRAPKRAPVPRDVALEARIAERVLSDVAAVNSLGGQVPFNCPECGGVLWQMKHGNAVRYRCHTGHAFTTRVLLAEQTKKIEETLWIALRMFEERKNLLVTMAESGHHGGGRPAPGRITESQVHIDRIRAILQSGSEMPTDLPHPKQ
jgi:two-component system, chemotaxis family, protein-glutamate methylesterase/glutaminase